MVRYGQMRKVVFIVRRCARPKVIRKFPSFKVLRVPFGVRSQEAIVVAKLGSLRDPTAVPQVMDRRQRR